MTRRRLPAPCAEPDCPTITRDTYCAAHAHRRRRRHPRWRNLRAAALAAEPNCRTCGAPATTADHIVPLADGGPELDPANVQPLCAACHQTKTALEA